MNDASEKFWKSVAALAVPLFGYWWYKSGPRSVRDRRWAKNREEAFNSQARMGYMKAQDKDRFMRQLNYYHPPELS